MAVDYSYFLKINNVHNVTNKQEKQIYELKNEINKLYEGDLLNFNTISNNGVMQGLLVVSTSDNLVKEILSKPDETFNVGDIISWDNNYWLIISKDMDTKIQTKGTMQLCNCVIKIQNNEGNILTYPCINTNDLGGNGLKLVSPFPVGASERTIMIACDNNTLNLRVSKRIYLDKFSMPTVYKITEVNNTYLNYDNRGIIVLKLIEDKENLSTDRPDLGICNYVIPSSIPPVNNGLYTIITCSNPTNTLDIGGDYRQLSVKFYNNDTEIHDLNTIWNFTYPVGYQNYFDIIQDNNQTYRVKVDNNDDLIGKELIVKVNDISNNYQGTITLKVR